MAIVEDIVIAGAPQGGLKGIDIAGSGFAMVQRTENDQATLQMEFARSAPQSITGDAATGDLFGYEVAASSIGQRNYVIIGSPGRSQAVGKEPENWGRALVYFEAADDSWNLEQDLSCENYASLNPPVFGHAVAASGQSVAVGAPAFKATESSELGAVGTYQLGSDGTWEEQWLPKPKSTDPKGTQRTDALDFGFSVAIDERFLIVGSPRDSLTHLRQGTVFVFERNDSEQWQLRQQLADPKAAAGEQFGYRLALRDEWLLVTSYSTRIAEGETAPVGHVSVYQLSNDRGQPWQFHQKLQASPKELPGGLKLERYGYGIAVSANMLAISAPTTSQAGVNHHGIVFLYTLDQETGLWRPSTQVLPSIGASRFGCAVEFGKDFLAVGSIFFTPGGAERSHRAGAVFCFDLKAL